MRDTEPQCTRPGIRQWTGKLILRQWFRSDCTARAVHSERMLTRRIGLQRNVGGGSLSQNKGAWLSHAMPMKAWQLSGLARHAPWPLSTPTFEQCGPMIMNNSTHEFERLLGKAALALWSDFPREVQENLFETAVAGDVIIRNHLASYLHDHHPKTAHPANPTLSA